ncbi:MAG: S1 RNA-binding domain-containing protein, partial [Cyanobacteriota bacterium]
SELADIDYESTFASLEQGKIIKGIVVRVDHNEALIDVGGKSEGVLPLKELANVQASSVRDSLQIGEEIELYILREANEYGQVTLSKKRVDQARGWTFAQEDSDGNKIIKAKVIDVVKGGLLVEIHRIRGFVPSSQLRTATETLEELKGLELPLKIIEINQKKNKLILSHRKALEDERSPLRAEVVANLEEGSVITGRIVRLVDFGAFVDVGGIDGLLPISEISWKRIAHPSEVLKAGDQLTVKVFKIDRDLNRVSLSLKRMQSDPWESIKDSFKEGEKVKGIVTKLAPFGAFIEVAEGVEALLPSSEISDEAINIEEFLPIGKEVEATIKKFKPSERKISLTFKEYVPGQDSEEENKADAGESDDSDKPKKARKKKEDEPQAEGQTPAEATV